jgi:hypothetical protein
LERGGKWRAKRLEDVKKRVFLLKNALSGCQKCRENEKKLLTLHYKNQKKATWM